MTPSQHGSLAKIYLHINACNGDIRKRPLMINVDVIKFLLTCAVESYPTPGDIDDSRSPSSPTS